jgi:hypothetical protein
MLLSRLAGGNVHSANKLHMTINHGDLQQCTPCIPALTGFAHLNWQDLLANPAACLVNRPPEVVLDVLQQ